MITVGPATRIFLALGDTDMRKGYDGLYALVTSQLGEDPQSGHLFLFANRQRTRLKVLCWDGSGLWVCGKRLERGRFTWPQAGGPNESGGKVRLSGAELAMLLSGIDLKRGKTKAWHRMNE
jgi:transposase